MLFRSLELCQSLTNCISFSFFPHFIIQGNWSRLSTSFSFTRRAGYFLIHIYAPCTLIVILSWISFCIPHDSTAARIALGITSVLTITTILNMLNTTMPKVISYCYLLDSFFDNLKQSFDQQVCLSFALPILECDWLKNCVPHLQCTNRKQKRKQLTNHQSRLSHFCFPALSVAGK